ncbi:hypothetical protein ACROYT_G015195 [Oculina patagonica]
MSDLAEDETLINFVVSEMEGLFEVERKLNIKWAADEIGDSGWRPGWYVAKVQPASMDTKEISVVYLSEPDSESDTPTCTRKFDAVDLSEEVMEKLETLTNLFKQYVSENELLRCSVDQQCGLIDLLAQLAILQDEITELERQRDEMATTLHNENRNYSVLEKKFFMLYHDHEELIKTKDEYETENECPTETKIPPTLLQVLLVSQAHWECYSSISGGSS